MPRNHSPDWPGLLLSLRRHAYRSHRDARTSEPFSRGIAAGLRSAANDIARELEEPLMLECDHRCRCVGQGECTACELLWLAHDLPALLKLADDRCACEQERQCDACGVADVARKALRHAA